MATDRTVTLLDPNEPAPFHIRRPKGQSPFFIICDHAGQRIPRSLGTLGVTTSELERHIAWDIGAAGTATHLSDALDAFAIFQTYSRLVIDCNRPLTSPSSIVTLSEHTQVPGNENVTDAERIARANEIYWPYHRRIRDELDSRLARKQPTVLVSMHSFTPEFKSQVRGMHAGILYHRDTRLAHRLLHVLREDSELVVGDNEPYSVSDATDYAIPEYGEKRGLLHVEMEIRQDLIAHEAGQIQWAARLADALVRSVVGLL